MINDYNFERLIKPFNEEEIKYLIADKNFTIIFFKNGQFIKSCYTILHFEKLFDDRKIFKRIHKSYIVNICSIEKIEIKGLYLKLKSGEAIPIGSKFASKIDQ